MCEMIRSGTVAFNDMCLLGAKEIGMAAETTGMRAHVCQGLFDLLPGRDTKRELKSMEANAYKSSGLVSFGIAPHSVYTCSQELLESALAFAKKKKLKIHTHAAETRKEVFDLQKKRGAIANSKRVFEYFDSLGYVNSNSIFAHAAWVTKSEIAMTGKKRATIVTNPASNLKLATGGICPVTEFDKAGANVCIGTDSVASNNSLNMFESMKLTALLQKHRYWKADILSAQRVLDFATINGANALGINSGKIEKSALADIILLDIGPNMVPTHDSISNLIYSANPTNVCDMIVDGKTIMRDRKILTMDEGQIVRQAQDRAEEIEKR
jgi:5-methylthioadenosine/S-adenosylhomocysteine deaminase